MKTPGVVTTAVFLLAATLLAGIVWFETPKSQHAPRPTAPAPTPHEPERIGTAGDVDGPGGRQASHETDAPLQPES